MGSRIASGFLILSSAFSIWSLVAGCHPFRSTEFFSLSAAIWTIILFGVCLLAGGRFLQPIVFSSHGRLRLMRLSGVIFGIHTLIVAGWFVSAWHCKDGEGAWVITLLLHYLIEPPSFAGLWFLYWRIHGQVWDYIAYAVWGGTFYALLPFLFSKRMFSDAPKRNPKT
jgi:hypothetical protein